MEKLQPLIRNHFWILVGLVIPLVLYGYYSANGSLVTATEEREKQLDTVKSSVSTGNVPNEDYVKKLELINEFLDASVQDAIVDLWRKQQERMTWPPEVAANIPEEFMAPFDQQTPYMYKGLYPKLIGQLQKRVQPVEPIDTSKSNPMRDPMGRALRPRTPETAPRNQKVILAAMVPHANFGDFGIDSQEMWDAQIDIWLTEILFDAIVKINADKESISEAVIRRIDVIELMGGTGEPLTKDANAQGDMGMGMGMGMDMGMMAEPGMSGGRGKAAPTEIGFSPEEEFGPAMDGAAGGMDMGMGMMPDMGMEGTGGPPAPKRYIADSDDKPYLERGFYMSVIIMQNKIADFIVTLANSDWPVQVRRFQVGANPYRIEEPLTTSGFDGLGMEIPTMRRGRDFSSSGRSAGGPRSMRLGPDGRSQSTLENPYAGNLPEFATAALNHPDLVRLDLCGVITMYKQPTEALEAVKARKEAEAAAAANAPQSDETSGLESNSPLPQGAITDGVDSTGSSSATPDAADQSGTDAESASDQPLEEPAPSPGTPDEVPAGTM